MRKHFFSKKVVAVGMSAGLVLGLAGAALAYWTSSGTGNGSGSTATGTSTWTVTVGTVTTDALTPGGPTESISYSVQNNDTGFEMLHQVQFTVENADLSAFDVSGGGNPDCTKADFNLDSAGAGNTDTVTVNQELNPNGQTGDTYSGHVTIALVDRHDTVAGDNSGNQDNCEGQTVPVHAAAS